MNRRMLFRYIPAAVAPLAIGPLPAAGDTQSETEWATEFELLADPDRPPPQIGDTYEAFTCTGDYVGRITAVIHRWQPGRRGSFICRATMHHWTPKYDRMPWDPEFTVNRETVLATRWETIEMESS